MANQMLIEGAYQSAPKFSGAGDAFKAGYQQVTSQFKQAKKNENEALIKANEAKAKLLNDLANAKINTQGFTPAFETKSTEIAMNLKNKRAEEIKNGNPYSLESKLSVIETSQVIDSLQGLGKRVSATLVDMAESVDMLSDVNDAEDYTALARYKDITPALDKDNNIILVDKENNQVTEEELLSYNKRVIEIPYNIYKDIESASGKLIRSEQSFQAIKPELEQRLINALNDPDDGRNFIFDSLGGKFSPYNRKDPAGNARLSKYQGLTKKGIEDVARKALGNEASENDILDYLKQEVLNGYMSAYEGMHRATHRDTQEATQEDINRAEKNKTRQGVISNVLSDFSNALTKTKDFNFLTSGKSIIYKGKKIKSVESGPGDKLTLVYDIGQEKEGAFDVSISDPSVINALLSSYSESNFSNFDDQAKLALKNEISKRYPKGGIIDAPPPGFDPYAAFR